MTCPCHDADGSIHPAASSRRTFLKTGTALALGALPVGKALGQAPSVAAAHPTPGDLAETAVARLFESLSRPQRELICFPFDHELRREVRNNWAIVEPRIDDMNADQQELCRQVMKGLCSEDGFERFMYQMDEDYGGFEQYHVALFGEPGGERPFEWVLTGRHVTLRVDGNSVPGAAFGGPIFYGHASHNDNEDPRHTDNVWWFQGEQANRLFQTFDETQRTAALIEKSEPDTARSIRLKGNQIARASGQAVANLDPQQKKMVEDLVAKLLQPFRLADADEVRNCLSSNGGIDALKISFTKQGDIGDDEVWDIWKLEGPAFSWFFRGSPHVHTWLQVADHA